MNETILMAELNRDRNIELRAEASRHFAGGRSHWLSNEFRRLRRKF